MTEKAEEKQEVKREDGASKRKTQTFKKRSGGCVTLPKPEQEKS